MCALERPFNAEKFEDLKEKIFKGEYEDLPEFYSKELKEIVGSMLQVDPTKRPKIG